jgi:hypothetical protein
MNAPKPIRLPKRDGETQRETRERGAAEDALNQNFKVLYELIEQLRKAVETNG